MPTEALDGPGSKIDANMENLSGQDTRIPYGPRRSELAAVAAEMNLNVEGMTRDEMASAIAAKTKTKGKKK